MNTTISVPGGISHIIKYCNGTGIIGAILSVIISKVLLVYLLTKPQV